MPFPKVLALSLACQILIFSCFAGAEPAADALSDYLSDMESLSGKFVQQTYSVEGERLHNYSGNFKLKRPGFFHWQVEEPGRQLLVSDGIQVWDYDEDLEQLIHNSIEGGDVYDSPMQLISGGLESISSHYRVELIANTDSFVLLPLEVGGGFSELRLTFDKRVLAKIEMIDAFGQRTEVGFSDTELNPALAEGLFRLQAPEGVDIISNVPGYGDLNSEQPGDD